VKLLEDENKFLKDYNQKLADKKEGVSTDSGNGPTESFLMNLKAVIDDSNKNSEAKIKNINNILSANSTREAFYKP